VFKYFDVAMETAFTTIQHGTPKSQLRGQVYFVGISFEKFLCKTIVSDKRMNKKIIEPV